VVRLNFAGWIPAAGLLRPALAEQLEAELNELKKAVEKIVDQRVAQTPTLTLIRRTRAAVGKVSEKEKGSASAAR
jgi:hypothetical protein